MITYDRSAFGLKLIFQAHGSALYRSLLPSLLAVALHFIYRHVFNRTGDRDNECERGTITNDGICEGWEEVRHPYAVGVLVTTSTFLIIFKLNQSYSRYWEACGNTHQFMSKWMDATTHTSVFHMQCDHYKDMRPPSFFDYPDLNSLCMTRDRERMHISSVTQDDNGVGNDGYDDETGLGLRNRKQTSLGAIPEIPPPQSFKRGDIDSSADSGNLTDESVRKTTSGSSISEEQARKKQHRKEMKKEYARRSVAKSINNLDGSRYSKQQAGKRENFHKNDRDGHSISSLYSVISKSIGGISMMNLESKNLYEEHVFHAFGSEPIPLVGKPRLDGNWAKYYTKNLKQPYSTFVNPHRPDDYDKKGFASIQGARTPPLFLQELAHLSSLLCAVALSTLRNDIEGCESPLAIYEPGQPFPEVDPNKDELVKQMGFQVFSARVKNFFGVGLTGEQRSKHNAAQPLPVIGGVSDAEIRFLQIAKGPYAKTQLCFNWLSEFIIREHLAGSLGNVAPPIVSRIFQFLGDGMIFYNHARKIMFIPFPFGHAQLSVFFCLVMVIVIPFLMHEWTDEPLIGTILTFLTVLCLFGINEVARDLENPFRNFPNELPLVNFQAQYNESLITMYAGYHPDFFWDGDQVRRMARSSGRGAYKKKQENGGHGSKTDTLSDGYINNVTIDVKPQKAGGMAPLDNIVEGDTTEVDALKLQLEIQAKLIKELFAKVEDMYEK